MFWLRKKVRDRKIEKPDLSSPKEETGQESLMLRELIQSEDMQREVEKYFGRDLLPHALFYIPPIIVHSREELYEAIDKVYTPKNEALRKEMQKLFLRIRKGGETVYMDELREIYANCLEILKDYPIKNKLMLERILKQCIPRWVDKQYDYVQFVDEKRDAQLHRLNEILKTVDNDFFYGTREFYLRLFGVLDHWDKLCRYPEVYELLAAMARCNFDDHSPCDIGYALLTIRELDEGISKYGVEPSEEPFQTTVSLADRYDDVRHEIDMYQGVSGYIELSGARSPKQMPGIIMDYIARFEKIYSTRKEEVTEEDLDALMRFEREGLVIYKSIKKIGDFGMDEGQI